jgi:hypothetical protein
MVKFQASRRTTRSAGAVSIVRVGREKADAQRKENGCHDLDHGVHRVEETVPADKLRPTVH